MKEIKAYIRCERAEAVVHALEQAGVRGLTLIDVMAVGENIDLKNYKFSIACVERYQKVGKLEMICEDKEVDRYVDIIREAACTHSKGDGIICVADVDRLVKIRTGAEGVAAL